MEYLEEDKLIGHKLIVQRKGLLGKKLSLKNIYYNDLITGITCKFDEVSPDSLYKDIHYSIKVRISKNNIDYIYLRNGGNIIGKSKLEKRINHLQFEFTDLYLKKALKILEEQEN
jgi:hypothetical protein